MFKFELDTAAKFLKDVMKPDDRATIFSVRRRLLTYIIRQRIGGTGGFVSTRTVSHEGSYRVL